MHKGVQSAIFKNSREIPENNGKIKLELFFKAAQVKKYFDV
jgi:hypothetical protein